MTNYSQIPEIYLINLDNSKDRLKKCNSILLSLGLHFERISAIFGDKLTVEEKNIHYCQSLNNKNYYRPLSNGEIGCYLSHREAWKKIAYGDKPYGIVLEDDISIERTMLLAINTINTLCMGWGIIKLAAYQNRKRPILYSHNIGFGFDLVIHNKPMSGCAAYAITKEASQKLLTNSDKFGRPVDVDIQHFWESNVEVFSILPFPASQDMSYKSTITNRKNKFTGNFWKRKKLQLVSHFRNSREVNKHIENCQKKGY